jgi:hypothetical protein
MVNNKTGIPKHRRQINPHPNQAITIHLNPTYPSHPPHPEHKILQQFLISNWIIKVLQLKKATVRLHNPAALNKVTRNLPINRGRIIRN